MKGERLDIVGLTKLYGNVQAIAKVDLRVPSGAMVTLLGPSGCGKTTLLRLVAGLVSPSDGRIHLGGREITHLPANRRNIGVVFQNYALFPHMSVAENVAFGLKARGMHKAEIGGRVTRALQMVALEGFSGRYPAQLSGGQQQRAALARALVIEPSLLLLDEPLSALDKNLRQAVQVELRRLQKQIGVTTIVVTHDQEEAFTLADQIAVMQGGNVLQIGAPHDLYDRPANRFVADFLGIGNFLHGSVRERRGTSYCISVGPDLVELPIDRLPTDPSHAVLFFRPERVDIRIGGADGVSGVTLDAVITEIRSIAGRLEIQARLRGGDVVMVHLQRRQGAFSYSVGQEIKLCLKREDIICLRE